MGTSATDRNLFLLVSFIFWFAHFLYIPILSPYIESLGGSYSFVGMVLASYGLMQLLFRFPMGISSDLLKVRRPFIIFGMLTSTLSCLTFALTEGLGWALFARSLAGLAAATWVAFTVLYSSYFTNQEVHRAMGSISFIVVLAQLMGMSLSGYIVKEWGWHAPFWLGAGTSIIGGLLSLLIYEPKDRISRTPITLAELTAVMKEPQLLKVSLLSILAHSIIFTTMFGFIPSYALQVGLEASDISLIVFSFMIPHAVATLFMGKVLVPWLGQWTALKMAFLLTAGFTFVTPFVDSKFWLCVIQAFNGFSLGLLFPLLLGMAIEAIPSEKRATAMGVYQALYAIGMFAGPFLAGHLNSLIGIAGGFYFSGILGIAAVGFILFWNSASRNYTNRKDKDIMEVI